jgi:Tfp pilus assembly protein PilE
MCSTGHPWSDGIPTCGCDPVGLADDYAPILVEPPHEVRARTIAAAPQKTAPAAATAVIAPAPADPILSDDGWWQWDGSAWVPAEVPPVPFQAVDAEPVALTEAAPTSLEAAARSAAVGYEPRVDATASAPAQREAPEWATWAAPVSATGSRSEVAAPPVTGLLAAGYGAGPGLATGPGVAAGPGFAAPLGHEPLPQQGPPAGYGPPGGFPPPGYGPPTGYPPVGYVGPPYGAPPQEGRDGLAIAALVCSLIPIFVVAQLLALIFAIIVLTRVGRTGQKGMVMAICAIAVSVVMFFISGAIAIPVFLNQREKGSDAAVQSTLRSAANVEESYFVDNQTYADAEQLSAAGELVPAGVQMEVAADGRDGYCLAAARLGGSRWFLYDSFQDGLQTTVFSSADDAIATCALSANDSDGGSTGTAAA